MTWTTPTHVAAGEADSAKFNEETVDNLLHIYNSGAARAYATGTTSISVSADTQVTLAGESFDVGGNFATSTYTCPRSGFLDVRGRVSVDNATDGQRFFASVFKNGAQIVRGSDGHAAGTQDVGSVIADVIEVTAGDQIKLYARLVNGTAKNTETGADLVYLTCRMVV